MPVVKESFTYALLATVAMFVDFSILIILVEYFNLWYVVAVALAFSVAAFCNFLLQSTFTFSYARDNRLKRFISFFAIGVIGAVSSVIIVYVCVEFLGLWYLFGKVFATVIVFLWNFLANKFITFKVV